MENGSSTLLHEDKQKVILLCSSIGFTHIRYTLVQCMQVHGNKLVIYDNQRRQMTTWNPLQIVIECNRVLLVAIPCIPLSFLYIIDYFVVFIWLETLCVITLYTNASFGTFNRIQ